ncbi:hypothetical protein LP420_06985 [Massilia sp. B-10]|nr:hypothetical protein LP420_06985 [Massilia sp. B-10]
MTDALPTDAIFAPTSFWYTPIPASVPLHPNTTGFVAEFLRQKAAYYGTVNINTWSYASPVYTAQADTPPLRVAYSIARTRFTVSERWKRSGPTSPCLPRLRQPMARMPK